MAASRRLRVPRLSPAAYRKITLVALVSLAFIAVTGAAVRLSGSGLGCPDWPTCSKDRVVADWEYHAMIEFVNRTITGLVSVAVIVAVLGSLVRQPRRADLTKLSLGLVAGVIGQIVLGGLTVLFDLRPPFVMAHFLVSMALIANAVLLHHRAAADDDASAQTTSAKTTSAATVGATNSADAEALGELRRLGRLLMVTCAMTLFLGTIVTSAGPHGGDENVARLGVPLGDVARIHGAVVMIFLVLTLLMVRRAISLPTESLSTESLPTDSRSIDRSRTGDLRATLVGRGEALLAVLVAQAAVGYTQYFTGVPAMLVGIHVAGACAVWVATLRVWLALPAVMPTTSPLAVRVKSLS